jgi:diacylglycerol kinase family enzyme
VHRRSRHFPAVPCEVQCVPVTVPQASVVTAATTPWYVVLNPGSGHEDAATAERQIAERLVQAGRQYEVLRVDESSSVEEAARQAVRRAQRDDGIVVAAGGDGTINAVAQAALEGGCRFGVIPQGTFNYFARTHGIPQETDAAVDALLRGRLRPTRIGAVNGHVFLVNASLGLYPETLEAREEQKQRHGRHRIVAVWAALLTVLRPHHPMRVRIRVQDRIRELSTLTLFVGANRLQLEQLGLADEVDHGDELLAVVLKPVSRPRLLWLVVQGALGRLNADRHVEAFGFEAMTVTPANPRARPVKVATDGEIRWIAPPLEFRLLERPLQLILPGETAPPHDA